MPPSLVLTRHTHRALGALVRIGLPDGGPAVDLTPAEAGILGRALAAVRAGINTGHGLYLSPIASDHDISFRPDGNGGGLVLELAGRSRVLPWDEVDGLAAALRLMPPAETDA